MKKRIRTVLGMVLLVGTCGPVFAGAGEAGAAARPGALGLYPDNPHYFQDAAGRPLLLIGDYIWGTFSDVDYDYETMFDTLRTQGLNFARVWVFWGNEVGFDSGSTQNYRRLNIMPYLRTGPGMANEGKPRFDLTRFNPAFFRRLRAVCTAARQRGIYLQLTLFDAWMIKHPHLWRLHACCRDNNVNGVDGDPAHTGKGTDGQRGFCSLGNPPVLDAQQALIRRIVDAVNEFDNIFFEIANENYYNAEWERSLCRFIHDYEKTKPLRHLTMPLDLPNHDGAGIKTWDLARLHRNLLKARGRRQPLVFDTDGIGNPDDATVRAAAWTAVVSGGHVSYLDDSLQPGSEHKGDFRGSRRAVLRTQLGHLARFATALPFWKMEPRDDLATEGNAFVFAGPNNVVAYLPRGGALTLDLTHRQSPGAARWFDPRTGQFRPVFPVPGGDRHRFRAPDAKDWVLKLTMKSKAGSAETNRWEEPE